MSSAPQPSIPSINQWNAEYLEEQYRAYTVDPSSVDPEIRAFFQGFDLAHASELKLFGDASPAVDSGTTTNRPASTGPIKVTPTIGRSAGKATHFEAIVDDLIGAYRDQGHLCAQIDPFAQERPRPDSLSLGYHG